MNDEHERRPDSTDPLAERPVDHVAADGGPLDDALANAVPYGDGSDEFPAAPGEDGPGEGDPDLHAEDGPLEPRTYPSTIGGAIYLVILACAGASILTASVWDWRLGVKALGCCLCAAAFTRLALSDANAGMLKVRNKYLDAFLLVAVGVALIVLSITVPDQPSTP